MADSSRQYVSQQRAEPFGPGGDGIVGNVCGGGRGSRGSGSGHGVGPSKSACDRCRGQKLRCIWDDFSGRCRRCTRADSVCAVLPRRAMGRPPSQQVPSPRWGSAPSRSSTSRASSLSTPTAAAPPPPLPVRKNGSVASTSTTDHIADDAMHAPTAASSTAAPPPQLPLSSSGLLGVSAGRANLPVSSLFPPDAMSWALGPAQALPASTSTASASSIPSPPTLSINWELPLGGLADAAVPMGLYNDMFNTPSTSGWASPHGVVVASVERPASTHGDPGPTAATTPPDEASGRDSDWIDSRVEMDGDEDENGDSSNDKNNSGGGGAPAGSPAARQEEINFTKQLCDMHVAVLLHPLHEDTILDGKYRLGGSLGALGLGRLMALTVQTRAMIAQIPTLQKEIPVAFDTATPSRGASARQRLQIHTVPKDRATALLVLSIYMRLEVAFIHACRILQDVVEQGGGGEAPGDDEPLPYALMPELAIDGFSLGSCHDVQLRFVLHICEQLRDSIRHTIAGIARTGLGDIATVASSGSG